MEIYRNTDGAVGLGTGGSGDVLAGIIVALLARGSTPLQATIWGVHLHALAGRRLSGRIGKIGFLASEIPAEIPAIMQDLSGTAADSSRQSGPEAP
jgi:NAD(P)H-hydrate repair Nnr-like enzyme with NAD(P)H-hydrate dehydratase domain